MSTEIQAWFAGRLPDEWFTEPAEVVVDREEITIVGTLSAPEAGGDGGGGGARGTDQAVPRADSGAADRDRARGRAPVPPQGRLGGALRRPGRNVHHPV